MNEHCRIVGRPFPKGQSGNPGGRPREVREVVELARAHGPQAIAALADIMNNPDTPPAARVAAANAILDRGWGKPGQAVELTGKDGGPIEQLQYITDEDRVAALTEFLRKMERKTSQHIP